MPRLTPCATALLGGGRAARAPGGKARGTWAYGPGKAFPSLLQPGEDKYPGLGNLERFVLGMQISLAPVPENAEFTDAAGVTKGKQRDEGLPFWGTPRSTSDYPSGRIQEKKNRT